MVIHCVVYMWKKSWLLKQNDYQRRVDYVTKVLDRIDLNLDHNYIKSELLSDEATCSVDTPVNNILFGFGVVKTQWLFQKMTETV